MQILSFFVKLGPMIFAGAFLMPFFAQIIAIAGIIPPFGLTPLMAGGSIALIWGLIAQFGGRWI